MNSTPHQVSPAAPRRGRPPKTATSKESLQVDLPEESDDTFPDHFPVPQGGIPNPPALDPILGLKAEEMMDWFYTYLPTDLAQAVYSGLRYTPSHLRK